MTIISKSNNHICTKTMKATVEPARKGSACVYKIVRVCVYKRESVCVYKSVCVCVYKRECVCVYVRVCVGGGGAGGGMWCEREEKGRGHQRDSFF